MKLQESMRELLQKELQHGEVAALSTLLSGEIAAVDNYNHAIQHVRDTELIPTLENCRNSHAMRVQILQSRLEEMGAQHLKSAGVWGRLTRFIENLGSMISDKFALSVLAAGEDFGFEQYHSHRSSLDVDSRDLVERELLPMQSRTLETMSMLCGFLSEEKKDKLSASHG